MNNNIADVYRAFLQDELSGPAHMNNGQVATILKNFDKLTKTASPDTSFLVIHEAYGATDTNRALNTVRGVIQSGLEKINAENPGVDKNPRSRLKALVERFNAALDKCGVTINGVDLDRAEIEKVKMKIPAILKGKTVYSATASLRDGKQAKLSIEILD